MANMCAKVTSTYMEFTLAFGPKLEFSFSFKFIQFLPIKSCIQHYKKKICSIFYCGIFDIMVLYMYERKSYTLPYLCA